MQCIVRAWERGGARCGRTAVTRQDKAVPVEVRIGVAKIRKVNQTDIRNEYLL